MEELKLYQIIGKRIKETRQNRGYTQQELADLIHLTRSSIANIEIGRQKLPIHVLYAIAEQLKIEPFNLLPSGNPESEIKVKDDMRVKLDDFSLEELKWIKQIKDKNTKEKEEN